MTGARACSQELAVAGVGVRRVSEIKLMRVPLKKIFEQYEQRVKSKIHGLLAPQNIIKAVKGVEATLCRRLKTGADTLY